MISEDFYGKKFVWWVGQVVDRENDKLLLGRYRVRIFGIHSDDPNLKKEQFPWAQIAVSPNTSKLTSPLMLGDYVFGFFQDGENGQIPVIIGCWPLIRPKDDIDWAKKYEEQGTPEKPAKEDYMVQGYPTTPMISQGRYERSAISITNLELDTSCDIKRLVDLKQVILKLKYSVVVEELRKGILAIIAALGSDPTGIVSTITSIVREIVAIVKKLKEIIDEIKEVIAKVMEVIAYVKKMIEFILSLPARLMQFIMNCFNSFMKELKDGFSELLDLPGISGAVNTSEITDLKNQLSEIVAVTKEVASGVGDVVGSVGTVMGAVGSIGSLINPSALNSPLNSSSGKIEVASVVNATKSVILSNNQVASISTVNPDSSSTVDTMSNTASNVAQYIVATTPSRDEVKDKTMFNLDKMVVP